MCIPIEILFLAIPLIIIHFSLVLYSLHNLFKSNIKSSGTKIGWIIIVVVLSLIGPLLFILFGREKFEINNQ